jgi:hypothetical protein
MWRRFVVGTRLRTDPAAWPCRYRIDRDRQRRRAAAGGGCGLRTVFVNWNGTVRGYALDAAGETQPRAVIPVNEWGPTLD